MRQFTLDDYLIEQGKTSFEEVPEEFERPEDGTEETGSLYNDMIKIISDACLGEFSNAELDLLFSILKENLPLDVFSNDIKLLDYVCKKHNELQVYSEKGKIHNRFNYFKALLARDTH